ncbi:type II secretion system protein GspM [Comamonas sp.]|uniref:type II secretion system protein GspM n=1 Tax=Comamonas sp. TaxID=34028 RepID=UPI002587D9DC|nr:type II secretion system protein GspM [Comamonas sp.]
MRHDRQLKLSLRQWLMLFAAVAVIVLPLVLMGQTVMQKHEQLQKHLQNVEPRYARLLALEQKKEELSQALEQANKLKASVLYPSEGDPGQLGNNVQNRLRSIMVKAGVTISSSQVKVDLPSQEAVDGKVQILISADGTISQIQLALISLKDIQPSVWLDELQINARGSVLNTNVKVDPVLSVRMVIFVPRSKGGV